MIGTILSLIGSFKGLIVGAIGLFAGIWALWAKRKMRKQADTIEQQEQAIQVHEAKQQVHEQDIKDDLEVEQRINDLQNLINQGKTKEDAAERMAQAMDQYFNTRDKE